MSCRIPKPVWAKCPPKLKLVEPESTPEELTGAALFEFLQLQADQNPNTLLLLKGRSRVKVDGVWRRIR